MLTVKELSYRYGKRGFALGPVSFSLEDGYLMCLIGRNGSGKTTLLQAIAGLLRTNSGKVLYDGEAGYVGGGTWYFSGLSMKENKDMLKTLYPSFEEAEYQRLLSLFELGAEDENKTFTELSAGQKMLFELAFVMARHPKLLLLDEPFANLDPVVKVDLAQLLADRITEENIQVILSTHLVDDISDRVDYIGVMEQGAVVKFGDRESLLGDAEVDGLREFILCGNQQMESDAKGGER